MQPQMYNNFNYFFGRIRFSPNGRKVCTVYPYRTVELYDFDNSTGLLSNVIKLDSVLSIATSSFMPVAFDVEFSPDGSKLYVSYYSSQVNNQTHPFLCQFDLTAGSVQAIAASKTILDSGFDYQHESMQLAIDGKLYIGQTNGFNLSVIHNPNATDQKRDTSDNDKHGVEHGTGPFGLTKQFFGNHNCIVFLIVVFRQESFEDGHRFVHHCDVGDGERDLRQFDDFPFEVKAFAGAGHDLVADALTEGIQGDVSVVAVFASF
jgi:hypothetical protein